MSFFVKLSLPILTKLHYPMKKFQLVFVPAYGAGHLISTIEAAKLLLERNDRLSITILIIKRSSVTDFTPSIPPSSRLDLIQLPVIESQAIGLHIIEDLKPHIRETVSKLDKSCTLAGFVLDMFCTAVIDIANEFKVPSYIFFTSSASFLGFMFHIHVLNDEHGKDLTEYRNSDSELACPSYSNPIPSRVMPSAIFDEKWMSSFLNIPRRFKEAKGILVNTFSELESHAVNSFTDGQINAPPIYPVGPILNLNGGDDGKEIIQWLDDQPSLSVLFLCFGSMGGFNEDQAKEIAIALENSGRRFLWALRKPTPMGTMAPPTDYQNLDQILPEGFLDRTAGIGKIIGWAPQVAVLAHKAIGGFVSHCGWNSILESIWFGVPIATWPMYAEQQFNAFQMVKELGLAAEITLDYKKDESVIVKSEDIEKGIRCVMEVDSEIRMKVKKMSDDSRIVLKDGGSSFCSLNRFLEDVINNMS